MLVVTFTRVGGMLLLLQVSHSKRVRWVSSDSTRHFSNWCDIYKVVKLVHGNWSITVTGHILCHL